MLQIPRSTVRYSEFLDSELTAEGFGDKPAASQPLLLTFKRKCAERSELEH